MRRRFAAISFVAAISGLCSAPSARAGTLVSEKKTTPFAGVELVERVESGPNNRIWAARISLCNDYIHLEATQPPTSYATPGSWGAARGLQLATNGDFYTSGPQVYGDAVGGGVAWPLAKTGKGATSSWYFMNYGWIAFGPDWVEFNHSERTKTVDAVKFGIQHGFKPTEVTTQIPSGTVALVSGFPELVIEGQVYTCSSPTASTCFPDRGDMKERHPRTAMGLSKDRKTFLLVTVDGRQGTTSQGMYGAELAELMGKLGAWEAFNLDGGGSTAMWMAGKGYVNNASGNNNGGGVRAVANHWGVFAGSASGKPQAPGSCFTPGGCYRTTVPGAESETFKDMPPGSFAHDEAISLYKANITSGCQSAPRLFCPSCTLTRAQAVTFLVRAAGISTGSPPSTPTFSDVPATHAFYAPIEAAAKAGIAKGCGNGNFCPDATVKRGELAAFIVRTQSWAAVTPVTPTFPNDVPTTHTFYSDIETLADKCVSEGCAANSFCPNAAATRGEAAVLVARAFDLDDANPCIGPTGSGGSSGGGGTSASGGTTSSGGGPNGGAAGAAVGGTGSGGAALGGGGAGATGGASSGAGSSGSSAGTDAAEGGCACRLSPVAGGSRLFGAAALLLALGAFRRWRLEK